MSNYSAPTRHPITGEIRMADWLDDSFGHHIYGVRFHGEEEIYASAQCVEISPDEMLAEIERLRAALHEWDALIRHQYSGSQEAMSDMTYAAQRTAHILYGDDPWPEPRRTALKGGESQ